MHHSSLRTRKLTYTALFTALIVVCTYITIPTQPPFTMQLFGVLCAALCLGARSGCTATFVYLALGAIGLPVFSGFSGGIGHLAGITGGFAVGFLPAAAIAGAFANRPLPWKNLGCLLALLSCYALGTAWFVLGYSRGTAGIGTALTTCVLPFLIPDFVKIALALLVSRALKPRIFCDF